MELDERGGAPGSVMADGGRASIPAGQGVGRARGRDGVRAGQGEEGRGRSRREEMAARRRWAASTAPATASSGLGLLGSVLRERGAREGKTVTALGEGIRTGTRVRWARFADSRRVASPALLPVDGMGARTASLESTVTELNSFELILTNV